MSKEWKRENKILKMMLLAPAAVKLKPDARPGIYTQVIVARGSARGRREYVTLTAMLDEHDDLLFSSCLYTPQHDDE
jgi:hypothetical protein